MKHNKFVLLVAATILATGYDAYASETPDLTSHGDRGHEREFNSAKRHTRENRRNETKEEERSSLATFLGLSRKGYSAQIEEIQDRLKRLPNADSRYAFGLFRLRDFKLGDKKGYLDKNRVIKFFSSEEFNAWFDFVKEKEREHPEAQVLRVLDEKFGRVVVDHMIHRAKNKKKIAQKLFEARIKLYRVPDTSTHASTSATTSTVHSAS